jgi:large subunit ribosomal protein L4
MNIEVFNKEGKATGRNVDLPDSVFGIEPNNHAIYLAVKSYLAAQRQGTHKAKEKGEITASTRKIKRQKGTGTARAGSLKSPVFRGGGRVFGPRPRTYSVKLNKKVARLARASALSLKMKEGAVKVLEDISFDAPRTKDFINVLNSLEVNDAKSILISGEYNDNLYLSARNCANSTVINANEISTYDILNCKTLLVSESAVKSLTDTLS